MERMSEEQMLIDFAERDKDFNLPVGDAWVIRYMAHFSNLALDNTRPESERNHFESNLRICRDLMRARELLRRIRAWDQLPETADGPFWAQEIDEMLKGTDNERQS